MWKGIVNSVIRVMGKISEATSYESVSINKLKHIINGQIEKPSEFKPFSKELIEKNKDSLIRERKPKTIRYAIMLAYQGKNYYGMQVSLF